jgi:excisionase family DNA binding protein
MNVRKNVLTTGEVARICNVAPRTVSKWFDSGHLRGYRIPGSKDRRIPLEQLVRFMRAHGIPLNGLETTTRKLLVLDGDQHFRDNLRSTLVQDGSFEVALADTAFEAGALAMELKPNAILVDVTRKDISIRELGRFVHNSTELEGTRLIGTATALSPGEGQTLLQDGLDAFVSKPFEAPTLIQAIEALVESA